MNRQWYVIENQLKIVVYIQNFTTSCWMVENFILFLELKNIHGIPEMPMNPVFPPAASSALSTLRELAVLWPRIRLGQIRVHVSIHLLIESWSFRMIVHRVSICKIPDSFSWVGAVQPHRKHSMEGGSRTMNDILSGTNNSLFGIRDGLKRARTKATWEGSCRRSL